MVIPLDTPIDDLSTLGTIELLETNCGPVFVLDLTSATRTVLVYCNASLREPLLLLASIIRKRKGTKDPKYFIFIDWATSASKEVVYSRPLIAAYIGRRGS